MQWALAQPAAVLEHTRFGAQALSAHEELLAVLRDLGLGCDLSSTRASTRTPSSTSLQGASHARSAIRPRIEAPRLSFAAVPPLDATDETGPRHGEGRSRFALGAGAHSGRFRSRSVRRRRVDRAAREPTGVLTGEVPRLGDRLRFAATVAPRQVLHMLANFLVAAVGAWGLAWQIAGGAAVAVVPVAVVFVAYVVWYARGVWWLEGELWSGYLLDLPRRRRAIPGPAPGTWATDVVPADGRYAVLLLHFGDDRRWVPPRADDVPLERWGHHPLLPLRGTRTVVALEWADDCRAAQAAAARMRPPADTWGLRPPSNGSI